MALVHKGTDPEDRQQSGRLMPSLAWIAAVLALAGGMVSSMRAFSDASGNLKSPGLDLIGYLIAVIGGAAFLAYADRRRDSPRRSPRNRPRQGSSRR